MTRFAILCGSAPDDFRQKKLAGMHDFLTSAAGGAWKESEITVFPNGVPELMLESVLNGALDDAAEDDGGEVLLYFCAMSEADLHAELSDCVYAGVEVVRLGENEIRREVVSYYADLAETMGIRFCVQYDCDGELASEDALGYRAV